MPLCSVLQFLVFMLGHCMFWYRRNYENALEMIDLMYVAVSTFYFQRLFLFSDDGSNESSYSCDCINTFAVLRLSSISACFTCFIF
jgi:hypothetical protein